VPSLCAILSLGLLGCSGSSESGWGGQFATAICARVFSCCNAAGAVHYGYKSEAQCVSAVAAAQQTSLNEGLATGLVRYDATAVHRCLTDISNASCAALLSNPGGVSVPPSCDRVIPGALPTGAACEDLDFACESHDCEETCAPPTCWPVLCPTGQYCDPGTVACVPGQAVGAKCFADDECDPSIVCRGGTCGAPLPDGSSCTKGTDCAHGACLSISAQTGVGTCGAPQPDGSPCTSSDECQSGGCNYAATGATCGLPTCTSSS
jgi:hypothetical protein